MPSFLIISPHSHEECLKTLENVLAAGYLTHYQWACPSGDHTGYVLLEAASKAEALMSVPSFVRSKAHAVELVRFDAGQVKSMHHP